MINSFFHLDRHHESFYLRLGQDGKRKCRRLEQHRAVSASCIFVVIRRRVIPSYVNMYSRMESGKSPLSPDLSIPLTGKGTLYRAPMSKRFFSLLCESLSEHRFD